ncbi:MAG TPA: hypothetical protein P5191_13115, partial [Ruminococcus sp.]|nr:hypothetical protein [Ruminococcus sp.]
MSIIWQYLDKRSAAVNALKDYTSMKYIIEHTDEDIANIRSDLTAIGSPTFSDMSAGQHNPQSGEIRMVNAIDEIDVLRERYRQAKEYMEWFQPAWDNLTEDERYVLEQFYLRDDEKQIDVMY